MAPKDQPSQPAQPAQPASQPTQPVDSPPVVEQSAQPESVEIQEQESKSPIEARLDQMQDEIKRITGKQEQREQRERRDERGRKYTAQREKAHGSLVSQTPTGEGARTPSHEPGDGIPREKSPARGGLRFRKRKSQ